MGKGYSGKKNSTNTDKPADRIPAPPGKEGKMQRKTETMLRLRPHHGLCLLHFVGEGYSDAFTENMSRVAGMLRAHPDTEIIVQEGCDDLCRHCPHRCHGISKDSAFSVSPASPTLPETPDHDGPPAASATSVTSTASMASAAPAVSVVCDSPHPDQFDAGIRARSGLCTGERLHWHTLRARMLQLVREAPLEELCPGCQWLPLCRSVLTQQD